MYAPYAASAPHAPASVPPGAYAHAPSRGTVGLNTAAERHAWKSVGLAGGGLLLSIVILGIGAVTGVLLLIGIPLFLIALIALPFTVWRLFDPTKYGTLRALGRTAPERRQVIDRVDAEISRPDAWQMRCGSGAVYMTPHFLVYKGSSVEVVRAEDVVWWWQKNVTSRGSRTNYVCVKTRQNHKFEMQVSAHDTHVMAALAQAYPFALAGFSRELDRCSALQLAAEVDRRRAAHAYGA